MKKYNIKMTATRTYEVDLEAKNEEAAEQLAMDECTMGNLDKDNDDIQFVFDRVIEVTDDGAD